MVVAAAALLVVAGGAFAIGHGTSSHNAARSDTTRPPRRDGYAGYRSTTSADPDDPAPPTTGGASSPTPTVGAADAPDIKGSRAPRRRVGEYRRPAHCRLAAAAPDRSSTCPRGRITADSPSLTADGDPPGVALRPAVAVLDGGEVKSGYGLHLDGVSYWRLVGFSVTDAQKGVVLDGTSHTVVQGLSVHQIGDEGIHVRSASSANLIIANLRPQHRLRKAKFGEGIYIGSANSNWCTY